jgi:alpha-L-rhamnosidase
MDVASFFTKWLGDVAADQYETGSVPFVVPDVLGRPGGPAGGAAGWADAAVIIPWTMYLAYGDTRILEVQYASMARWVEYMRSRAGDDLVWDGDFHFGDWLAFASTSPDYPGATTGKDLIATAFFAHSTDLLARAAHILGRQDDAARYGELHAKVKDAFRREFVTETGRVGENTQTAYVLALHFDLLPESLRPAVAERLAREVRARGHLTTGFLGTPYLCHVLSRFGYLDEAYQLLNREEYPSWLYPVKQGATTIWERWDGQKPDGSFQDVGMNSFNHYAYGAIGDWMYSVMAGIDVDPAAPGYKHVLVQPRPGGGFKSVRASHETMYGRVVSAWKIESGAFELAVEVPANTRATVRLPGAKLAEVTEGGKALATGDGVAASRQDGDSVVVEVGSGRYAFAYPTGKKANPVGAMGGVAGSWKVVMITPAGNREAPAELQLDGERVTGTFGTSKVEGTFANGVLKVAFPLDPQQSGGMSGTIELEGTLDGDAMKGTWKFGTFGGDFTASRVE